MSKKKKSVMFIAYSGEQWMGGVYYIRNMVYQFLEYAKSSPNKRYRIYIYTTHDLDEIFEFCKSYKNVVFIYKKDSVFTRGDSFIRRNLRELQWILRIYSRRIDYIYPSFSKRSIYRKRIVSWIPDFQHVYFPDFFSEEENRFRNRYFEQISLYHSKLILSSKDAYDTYKALFPECLCGVGVVHFVSAIFPNDISGDFESLLKKYKINNKNFFIVSNQFYRHKNHITLFRAVKELIDLGFSDIQIVCTGMTQDIKDASFFEEIEEYIVDNNLESNIHILGLISRKDQLVLMKEAIAVIQPSLFEGWGTSAEDAKTMGKILVLSDIAVHREQANANSLFFEKDSSTQLAVVLKELWLKYYDNPKEYKYCIENAVEYGKMFADILEM